MGSVAKCARSASSGWCFARTDRVRRWAVAEALESRVLLDGASISADDPLATDFYGQDVSVLRMLGHTNWGEVSPGAVSGDQGYHVSGVVVDRSLQPNAIYVADSGNNRILGFRGIESAQADLVFGQPDVLSSGANGDANLGVYAGASSTSLALMDTPGGTNLAEQWMFLNFDVDAAGNLYVPDTYNNRVLEYYSPFSDDKSEGKGDTVADRVIGQANFSDNLANRGQGGSARDASSIRIDYGVFDFVASRGVSVDPQGNVWVADTANSRVLRFPPGQDSADLVLGQSDFTSYDPATQLATAPLDRMCAPTLARVDPETGDLYVIDEYPGGFPARILVFSGPLQSGMAASRIFAPKQPLAGDFAQGYQLHHATGMVFNPVKTDDWIDPQTQTQRYRDGFMWLQDGQGRRILLLDRDGNILQALLAPDITTIGSQWGQYKEPDRPYYVGGAGGMIGFDDANNIYIADGFWHRVARFAMPYRPQESGSDVYLPNSNGGLLGPAGPNGTGPAQTTEGIGVATFGRQLILHDNQRYLVWNDYLSYADGAPADLVVGQADGTSLTQRNHIMGRTMHAIDQLGRMWATGEHGKLMVYQLPMVAGAMPLRELVPLYWADQPDVEVPYFCGQALAFEPATHSLWIGDGYRLLRVRIPDDISGKLLVDAVIGQTDTVTNLPNRGMDHPDAASFGSISDIKFDPAGNMFVVDNAYELHPNGRVIGFLASDMLSIQTMLPPIQATFVYVAERLDQPVDQRTFPSNEQPMSPVSIAFNADGEMVIGSDGYYRHDARARNVSQVYLYRHPLTKPTPDAIIQVPLGAPGEMTFDAEGDLIVQDHTYNKVWILNYDRDPSWLMPIGDGLYATYWPSVDFTGTPVSRIDRELSLGSDANGRWPVTDSDDVSARWTGEIVPRYTETYTLWMEHDDGARLWIDNLLVVDGWNNAEWTYGTVQLQAGVAYDIKVELRSWGGGYLVLHWRSPSQIDEVVPQGRLFSGKARPFFGILGDFNGDGSLDAADQAILDAGSAAQATRPVFYADGDINEDHVIDAADYALFGSALATWQQPHLSISDVRSTEGSDGGTKSFDFQITLSRASTGPVSFDYTTAPGTALPDVDFTTAVGHAVIPAGQTSAVIGVTVAADELAETDESFFVDLSNAVGAIIADASGVGTIVNDDAPPQLLVSATSITMPEGQSRQINVHLSKQSSSNVLVNLVKLSGGPDFASSFSLEFTPSDWNVDKTIRISAAHDGDAVDDHAVYRLGVTSPLLEGSLPVLIPVTATDDGASYAPGTGLRATFFDDANLTGTTISRVDGVVDFSWYAFSPDPAIGKESFSARWAGWVHPRFSEMYTFSSTTDGGVRLWVDGQLVIDSWAAGGLSTRTGTITLTAGRPASIRLEYCRSSGSAVVDLKWQSESQELEVVPQARLLGYAPAVIEGGEGDDSIYVRVDPADAGWLQVFKNVPVTGAPTDTLPLDGLQALTINTRGGNDTVTIVGVLPFNPIVNGGTGQDSLNLDGADFTFDTDARLGSDALVVNLSNAATVRFNSTQHLAGLTIGQSCSAALSAGGDKMLATGSLSITGSGKLNLKDNGLVVGTASVASVKGLIQSGYNNGTWTGPGIFSDAIIPMVDGLGYAAGNDAAVGYMNRLFHGESFDDDSVLVTYTRLGDADLSGAASFGDLSKLLNNYNGGGGWTGGDFNYDGSAGFADLGMLLANYDSTALSTAPAGPDIAPSADPAIAPDVRVFAVVGAKDTRLKDNRTPVNFGTVPHLIQGARAEAEVPGDQQRPGSDGSAPGGAAQRLQSGRAAGSTPHARSVGHIHARDEAEDCRQVRRQDDSDSHE